MNDVIGSRGQIHGLFHHDKYNILHFRGNVGHFITPCSRTSPRAVFGVEENQSRPTDMCVVCVFSQILRDSVFTEYCVSIIKLSL